MLYDFLNSAYRECHFLNSQNVTVKVQGFRFNENIKNEYGAFLPPAREFEIAYRKRVRVFYRIDNATPLLPFNTVPIVKAEMNDEQKKSINIREMLINRNIKKDKDTVNVSLMECKLNPLELRDYSERQSLHDLINLDAQPLFNKPLNLLILIIVLLIGGGLIVSYLTGGFGL
jgi:hypothetical protein